MYILASLVIKELTGKKFHEFLSERILQPLTMNHTNFPVVDVQKDFNYAKPYIFVDAVLKKINFLPSDPDDGSGSINSSIADMSKWFLFHLNNGKYNDIQLVSKNNLHETYKPTTILPDGSFLNIIPKQQWSLFATYGLDWIIEVYRGHKIIQHDGLVDGFRSSICFLPDDKIGIICLTNEHWNALPIIIPLYVLDLLLHFEQINWDNLLRPLIFNLI